jgi:hypothetical protein
VATLLQIHAPVDNVGDRLAPLITERLFGYTVARMSPALMPVEGRRVLSGLGSSLGGYGDWTVDVWGTGHEPGYTGPAVPSSAERSRWRVHAVRGPLTKRLLQLDEDIPIGDPALATPLFYRPKARPTQPVRYFTHCDNDGDPRPGEIYETVSTRIDPFAAIDLIAASDFVLTEALHVAILAHAYGIPWAWAFGKHRAGIVKWHDWLASVGATPERFGVREERRARAWHHRQRFRAVDVARLLGAFPHDIAF